MPNGHEACVSGIRDCVLCRIGNVTHMPLKRINRFARGSSCGKRLGAEAVLVRSASQQHSYES